MPCADVSCCAELLGVVYEDLGSSESLLSIIHKSESRLRPI